MSLRRSGLAGAIAGPAYAVFLLAHPDPQGVVTDAGFWIADHTLGLLSWILALVAFAGLARASEQRGYRTGWALLMLGAILQSGVLYGEAFYYPALAGAAPQVAGDNGPLSTLPTALLYLIPNLVLIAGAITTAVTARATTLPYRGVLTFAIGAAMIALPPVSERVLQLGSVVYAAGLLWLGLHLTRRADTALRPPTTSAIR